MIVVPANVDGAGRISPTSPIVPANGDKAIVFDGNDYLEFGPSDDDPILSPLSLRSSADVIPADFFGMHLVYGAPGNPGGSVQTPFPSIGIGVIRSNGDYASHRYDEPNQKGTYSWTRSDAIIAQALANGCKVIATLPDPPDWATAPNVGGAIHNPYPYNNLQDLRDFIVAYASRNAGKVWCYEGRNEANSQPDSNGIGFNGTIQQLVDEQATLYAAVKAGDPAALVATFPISYLGGTSATRPVNYLDSFLQAMVADGRPFADAISVHGYMSGGAQPEQMIGFCVQLRLILQKYNLHHLPLICSEFGFRDYFDIDTGTYMPAGGVMANVGQQVAYVCRMYLSAWLSNFSKACYYAFDKNQVMCIAMINYPSDVTTLLHPALGYNYIAGLLAGGTLWAKSLTGSPYLANFTTRDGRSGLMVWCIDRTTATVSASGYTSATDCLGNAVSIAGGSITATYSPVFLFR